MSDSSKAVFLSYASQDAEAAKRIADALRGAGVEVWFDQSELVGGDAWDAKIRKQIKECALLIPIISQNTQARTEGYFRLEWRLADQRTHLMAKGRPFLLPVVIDETKDAEAHVPDSFTEIQWTKAPGGEVPAAFAARVQKLLGGSDGRESLATPARSPQPAPLQQPSRLRLAWIIGGVAALAIAGALGQKFLQRAGPAAPMTGAVTAPALTESRQLADQARALIYKPGAARAELEAAEELCKKAAGLDPTDAEVLATWSQTCTWFLFHGFDGSPEKREAARAKAARALQLDPNSFEARFAQAFYLVRGFSGGVVGDQGEAADELLRGLLRDRPDEPRAILMLAFLRHRTGRSDEARALLAQLVRMPAFASTAWGELGWIELTAGNYAAAEAAVNRATGPSPIWRNLVLKILLALEWRGDLTLALATQRQLPAGVQLEDVGAIMACYTHALRREPDRMLQVLDAIPRDWLRTAGFEGPKAYWAALAHEQRGERERARTQWRFALKLIEAALAERPTDPLQLQKAHALAALGEMAEAGAAFRLVTETDVPKTGPWVRRNRYALTLVRLGRAEAALDHLERIPWLTAAVLRHDPELDSLRSLPRFQALLARLEADPSRTPVTQALGNNGEDRDSKLPLPDDKSVAVLAFANLSDDKANEYFSDGISEELLNVLAKVPGLKVSARTSAFYFKGKDTPIPEIAKQLGVAYVVEGSVRKAGDKVRITAQLIKAADGFHVWSETFTRDLKDIFAVQDEIAGLIAQNLSLRLGLAASVATWLVDPEAFRLYLEGRAAWNRRDVAGLEQAERLFNRALEIEPRFARAHAALADVWTVGSFPLAGSYGQRQSPQLARTIARAAQAVALDDSAAEAHAALGHSFSQAWRFDEAQRELRRAIELNPNYASAHQWLGRVLLSQGRIEESLAALQRAASLDPLSHRILDNYSDALQNAGRLDEAWTMISRAVELHPSGVQIRCKQALLLMRLGRRAEALAAARVLAASDAEDPDYRYGAAAAVLHAFQETAEAEGLSRRINPKSVDYPIALAYLDRREELVRRLDDLTINWINNLWFERALAPIRADPAVREWTSKVGLDEALARAEAWLAAHPAEAAK